MPLPALSATVGKDVLKTERTRPGFRMQQHEQLLQELHGGGVRFLVVEHDATRFAAREPPFQLIDEPLEVHGTILGLACVQIDLDAEIPQVACPFRTAREVGVDGNSLEAKLLENVQSSRRQSIPRRSEDREEVLCEDVAHFARAIPEIIPLLVKRALLSEFGFATLVLPVDMAPAVLVPAPERIVGGSDREQTGEAVMTQPGGYHSERERCVKTAKQSAQGREGPPPGTDVVSAKKHTWPRACRPDPVHCVPQTLAPIRGELLP
jgi:hypothetical protein